jgi:hypothetical protein
MSLIKEKNPLSVDLRRGHVRQDQKPDLLPIIQDPFTQVRECVSHATYQGAHTFLGDSDPKPPREEWKIVPITNFGHFLQGLDRVIGIVKDENTQIVESPFATANCTRLVFKNPEEYLLSLNNTLDKFIELNGTLFQEFNDKQKSIIQQMLDKAKGYIPYNPIKAFDDND